MLRLFLIESEGQDLVEYALLIAIVALGAVVALNSFQNVIFNVWNTISNSLSGS